MGSELLFPLQDCSLGLKVTTETSRPPSLRPCPLILARGGFQVPLGQFPQVPQSTCPLEDHLAGRTRLGGQSYKLLRLAPVGGGWQF